MICAICGREGQGFCWMPPRLSAEPRLFKRFCSRVCQLIHSDLPEKLKLENTMINPTPNELKALKSVLQPLCDYVASIGMDKSLSQYQRSEVIKLIDVVITAYQDKLRELTPDDAPLYEDDIPF